MSQLLTVHDPRGYAPKVTGKRLAARPEALDGKTLYLVDCLFDNSEAFMQELQDWFATRLPAVRTKTIKPRESWVDDPEMRATDFPAGGLMTTAGDIALFYQALLNDGKAPDGTRIWQSEMLREARRIRSGNLLDPARGMLANRALGIVIAGGDGKANLRGFGRTNSPEAFGHPGFGGQIGWADPATGISFGYLTNGYDRNDLREGRRGVAVCSLAGACRN